MHPPTYLARWFLALLTSFVLFSHRVLPQSCFLRHFFSILVAIINDETNYHKKQRLLYSQLEESCEIRPFFAETISDREGSLTHHHDKRAQPRTT
jgi:hypothetical protein